VTNLAEIFRQYGRAYRAKFGARMLASHRRAMADIEQCRTAALGGQVCYCDHCDQVHYCYHSCQNRHCPQCQHRAGQAWLEQQQDWLLPVPYFMVTFTLPQPLRKLARSHQRLIYDLLFRCSAAALQALAQDPRFVGADIGLIGVLQTWARDLSYHPHVHYLVPGGGVCPATEAWRRARNGFLVHGKPLSKLFRGKFRAALTKTKLYQQVPAAVWQQEWVVHCQSVGSGTAALKYLAPYIFRVALSNNRIVKVQNEQITFRYNDNKGKRRYCTLPVQEFMRRSLRVQHVLPKGFKKVRYYGLFSPAKRELLNRLRLWLLLQTPPPTVFSREPQVPDRLSTPSGSLLCPKCGRPMRRLLKLEPIWCRSP
jgi:hypothetical protein